MNIENASRQEKGNHRFSPWPETGAMSTIEKAVMAELAILECKHT